jgi:dTDP-4-dehydrorhamnose 3,5-epimerase
MVFTETTIKDAFIIEPELIYDERGFFARTWSEDELLKEGLNPKVAQQSISHNRVRGTLRGMHYQIEPFEEVKLVRCTAGSVFDVIVDLRENSATFHNWVGLELSSDNRRVLYIPKGFAHGFQTLEDDTEVFYQMSEYYHPEAARGLRWNDPTLGIDWPIPVTVISERDREHPLI